MAIIRVGNRTRDLPVLVDMFPLKLQSYKHIATRAAPRRRNRPRLALVAGFDAALLREWRFVTLATNRAAPPPTAPAG